MKRCSRCGDTKALGEYYRNAAKPDGVSSWCKPCSNASTAAWQAAHPEKVKKTKARWVDRNRKKVAEINMAWARANRDKSRAIAARYRAAHRDELQEVGAAWREENPEKARAASAAWRDAHPQKNREYCMRRKARKLSATVAPFTYDAVLWRDGYRCYLCGGDVKPDDLHYDHVRPLSRGGEHSYDNVRVTHATCNMRKGTKSASAAVDVLATLRG